MKGRCLNRLTKEPNINHTIPSKPHTQNQTISNLPFYGVFGFFRSEAVIPKCSAFTHVLCFANDSGATSTFRNVNIPLRSSFTSAAFSTIRSSPRPISNSQLHTLLYFHLCPIYLVVFKGSYFFRMGYLILRGASRLDAFSVYPFQTWLLGHALGRTTGTPAVRPPRSSRTKGSSSQISYAHAG